MMGKIKGTNIGEILNIVRKIKEKIPTQGINSTFIPIPYIVL